MTYLMGIDIGTSSLKVMLIDETGVVHALCSRSYQYDSPLRGYAQQDPEVWWRACVAAVRQALRESGIPGGRVAVVGFSGQMHGMVCLDENGNVVRPAILHCDARSGKQVRQMKERLGHAGVCELMMNPVYTGFLLPSLLWVRENEPGNYEKIRRVCLPKDYIRYRLTGELCTDYSDASATLAFDLRGNCWSGRILELFEVSAGLFPPLLNTDAVAGRVSAAAAAETGLSEKTAVVAGGGDQIMQGIGCGAIHLGTVTANIGSSGQLCFQSEKPLLNPELSTNLFCGYRKGRYIAMGAIMHAGLALKWLSGILGERDFARLDAMASQVRPGSGGVLFLPYLNGERTPHMNPDLSAMFLGCSTATGRPELARAVMEGVAFALKQCIETCEVMGLVGDTVIASGGGARSRLWLRIQSDIYGLPLKVARVEEQACLGAAIVGGVGARIYDTVEEGCAAVVRYQDTVIVPDGESHSIYLDYYELFKEAYPANRQLLRRLTEMGRSR